MCGSGCLFGVGVVLSIVFFFFFNDTATTEIYTLSLHDALPICTECNLDFFFPSQQMYPAFIDRKSTRLNSSHQIISYAVFCLKKKKKSKQLKNDSQQQITSARKNSTAQMQ